VLYHPGAFSAHVPHHQTPALTCRMHLSQSLKRLLRAEGVLHVKQLQFLQVELCYGTCAPANTCTLTFTHTHSHTPHIHMLAHTHIHTLTHTHVYTRAHTHTHRHTHVHTHMQNNTCACHTCARTNMELHTHRNRHVLVSKPC
jgi:hypothetical protein